MDAPPLTFNELLVRSGIDPAEVLVFRHRPWESKLNRAFDWIVAERPDLFDCYQDSHAPRTEASLLRAKYVASFIRHASDTALFVGLYERLGQQQMTEAEYKMRPKHQELMALGMSGDFSTKDGRGTLFVFNLADTKWHADWRGKLVIKWPGGTRSWCRWADRNMFEIDAIAPSSLLTKAMPDWHQIALSWAELSVIPAAWRAALAQWRGVYLIIDQSDGMQYVGSACGSANIIQRWDDYARSGHGGNRDLKGRDPAQFRFSILQLVSPDLSAGEVIALENSWKERLRTRAPFGLNAN